MHWTPLLESRWAKSLPSLLILTASIVIHSTSRTRRG